jgi:hypothetical protein
MVVDPVELHPLAPVTVTVYVPGVVTFKVAEVPRMVDPLDHEYVPPPEAVKARVVRVQVSSLELGTFEMATTGAATVWVMVLL